MDAACGLIVLKGTLINVKIRIATLLCTLPLLYDEDPQCVDYCPHDQ